MGLIDNIKQMIGRVNVRLPFIIPIGGEKTFGKSPMEGNYDLQSKSYRSWVYAAATRNSFSIAKAKLRLYKEQMVNGEVEQTEITEHPYLDLMKDVNPHYNRFELMSLTSLYQDLVGNAYWWMPKGRLGVPVAIWPLQAQFVRVVPDKKKFIAGYVLKAPHVPTPIPFDADEIVHFRYPNPNDMFYGLSPTLAAALSIDMNKEFKTWGLNFLLNNAQPSGVLQTEKSVSAEQYNRLRDQWNEKYRGSKNSGKLAILGQGLKYEKTGSLLKEMDVKNINPIVRDEILAIFGVPPSKLGLVEDVNRANAESSDYTYQKETVLPRLTLMEEKINEKIMPMYTQDVEGIRLVVKFDSPVPQDKEFRLKEQAEHIKSGYSSIDDEREKDGEEPYNKPETQSPLIPFSVTPAGTEREDPTATEDEEEEPKKSIIKVSADAKWDLFDATAAPQEKLFERTMRKFFKEQNEIIAENIGKFKSVKEIEEDRDSLQAQIIWNMNEQNTKLTNMSEPHIRQAFTSGVNLVEKELGIDFTLAEPNILRAMQRRITFFATEVNETTVKILSSAIEKGESIADITTRLQTVADFNVKTRAKRVAQTEVIGGTNDGQFVAYKEAGMTHKKWLTARDEKVRDTHREAGKQGFISINNSFSNGLLYPGDRASQGSTAAEVINCRCTLRSTRRR